MLQAQECAQQILTQSLVVAGAEVALQPTQQDALLLEGSLGYASTGQQTSSQVSEGAASTAAMSSSGQADATGSVTAPEQVPKAVVPTLDLLARPATAAKVASAMTSDAERRLQGLVQGSTLPTGMLDWAVWLPTDSLLHQLSSPASGPCNQPAAGTACPAPAPTSAVTGRADAHSTATLGTAAAGAVLSRSCIPAPEMLLANLQVLSEQLQAAVCHVAALPVLQLARLVAVVTLNNQVSFEGLPPVLLHVYVDALRCSHKPRTPQAAHVHPAHLILACCCLLHCQHANILLCAAAPPCCCEMLSTTTTGCSSGTGPSALNTV